MAEEASQVLWQSVAHATNANYTIYAKDPFQRAEASLDQWMVYVLRDAGKDGGNDCSRFYL